MDIQIPSCLELEDKISREQMSVMMYRYPKYKGFDVSGKAELDGVADDFNVNEFVKEAMELLQVKIMKLKSIHREMHCG